ncbi:hypothetical protein HBI38_021350 [Parastagonospora nodorum]|nr:hypothetical protein HBI09_152370 [Parastagonospora nodorum]KAH4059554.1 hypothetical protein HBH49_019790 [Parastagonospora nodorum]KAH4203943.1 hypothetical protein HBH42_007820 [Parastagonospora nodorum]KAH4999044.1 hypothetical protein HBI77_178570 [Parastagonospora nodorum]KAH5070987.1 hypothetical protein HBH96_000150 [Parastagonospora nodorum]
MPAQVELAHHLSVARFPCQVHDVGALQQPLCEALVSSEPVIVVTHHDNHTLGSLDSTYQTLGYDAEPYGTLQMHYSFGQYKPVWANISSVQMSALLAWSSYRS